MLNDIGPAIVRPADDLGELAAAINASHEAGEAAVRRGLDHFRAAGEKLLEAKRRCGHGRWTAWLKASVAFSGRTARDYMRLAEHWGKVAAAANLRDALRMLSEERDQGDGADQVEAEAAALPPDRFKDECDAWFQNAVAMLADPAVTVEQVLSLRHAAALLQRHGRIRQREAEAGIVAVLQEAEDDGCLAELLASLPEQQRLTVARIR